MSLLEFVKENKEYFDVFNDIINNDIKIRSQSIKLIIKKLNDYINNNNNIIQLNQI